MAPAERRHLHWLYMWLEAAVLLLTLVAISSDSFASAQCSLVADFDLCPCRSLGSDRGFGVDCNGLTFAEITEALRASETMRTRTESL